jgi:hypothetical protein
MTTIQVGVAALPKCVISNIATVASMSNAGIINIIMYWSLPGLCTALIYVTNDANRRKYSPLNTTRVAFPCARHPPTTQAP